MSAILPIPGLGRLLIGFERNGEALWVPGGLTMRTNLRLDHLRSGELIESRDLGSGLVTNTAVTYIVKNFANQATFLIANFHFHDTSTGVTAAATTDTALTTVPPAGVPARANDSAPTFVAAPASAGAQNATFTTVGTQTYTGTLAITEWGLFDQSAQGGNLFDHRVFAAVNVVSGDSVKATYTLTVTSGG